MQTCRDAQIVAWLGRIGAAGSGHVEERFGMSRRVAYRRLASLKRDGLVEHRMVLHGWPGMYSATAAGLRWQGLECLPVFRVRPAGFEHAWRVASVAVALHRELPGWEVWGEREIKAHELASGGGLFASARVGSIGAVPMLHRPDLAIVSPDGRVLAIEVELSVKAPVRLVRICRGWARACHLAHVYYLAVPSAGRAVERAVRTTNASDRVTVLALDEVQLLAVGERRAAASAGAEFWEWTPGGPLAYNPFAHGGDTEIADKALAGETFTEPHYLRQAQRYLGHAVRAMHAARIPIAVGSLMEHMDQDRLERTARELPEEQASVVQDYLDSLTDRQKRDLAGVRDRLSILAESDIACWLSPRSSAGVIDLHRAVERRAVVYFALDADRRPLLSKMLGAAILADLVTLAAERQSEPVPVVVAIDEFPAIGAGLVGRLFGRARSAGMSVILATHEMADLEAVGDGALRDQVIGNVESVLAYRQNVPDSAELIAGIAGTRPAWITTERMGGGLFGHGCSGHGSRTLGREYEVHPARIKKLRTGQALVITLTGGQSPAIAEMHHPDRVYGGFVREQRSEKHRGCGA